MSSIDHEDQLYQEDVDAVKKWWTDSRWRFTKRPFTAEQIVAKRGNLKIEYPQNAMSKKLWKIFEGRFKVSHSLVHSYGDRLLILCIEWRRQLHLRVLGPNHAYANGKISRHCLRLGMAMFLNGFFDK